MTASPSSEAARRLVWPASEVLALVEATGSPRRALELFAFRLAEDAGWLDAGTCASLARAPWQAVRTAQRDLNDRTAAALGCVKLPEDAPAALERAVRDLLAGPGADPLALSGIAETILAGALSPSSRRGTGIYFTPPELAAQVVDIALRHGNVAKDGLPRVHDPCAGGGAFLVAAARALAPRAGRKAAALACSGADLSGGATHAAHSALVLEAGPSATRDELQAFPRSNWFTANSLFHDVIEPVDLLVSNPPYGHLDDAVEREMLAERYPALRGGEIDRYAAFLLRSLELIRDGGTAALLVPDTWMTNARGGELRAAILKLAEIAAVVDLGKPFSAAKDTRVQAVVMVRGAGQPRPKPGTFVGREKDGEVLPLAPLDAAELRSTAARGWQPYRTPGERDLCAAIEAAAEPLGAVCAVGYGLRTGNNRLHLVRERGEGAVELLGGEDLVPFAIRWRPKWLRHDSVAGLRGLIDKQRGRPRVAVQRIRTNSQKPWARWLEAAMCPPERVCLDSLSTLSCEDDELLWALLGVVGSVALDRVHRLRTTDVNVKPSSLRELPVPRALREEVPRRTLADLVRARAAEAAREASARQPAQGGQGSAPLLERRIDRAVYELFGLSERLIDETERGFWGDRFDAERARLP